MAILATCADDEYEGEELVLELPEYKAALTKGEA
jgi:hypothetical protein